MYFLPGPIQNASASSLYRGVGSKTPAGKRDEIIGASFAEYGMSLHRCIGGPKPDSWDSRKEMQSVKTQARN